MSFIAAIPMFGDAVGLTAEGTKYACVFNKIVFGTRALANLATFGRSLSQISEISADLTQKHIVEGKKWDSESTLEVITGLGYIAEAIFSAYDFGNSVNGFANSQCFVAGTLVLTIEGNKPIEEIKAGDLVYSTDPETGESEYKEVVQTFENETEELVHISVAGEEIVTTPKHTFYVPHKGWTSAIDLRAGDILVLSNGEYVIVEKVQHEILERPVKVYNFEVQDFHTYYVGENSVLVHNSCGNSKKPNGYSVEDIDEHGLLSPGQNRSFGNHNVANEGKVQSHHIIQDKWARSVPGYDSKKAPAILLETGVGKPHTYITNSQMARRRLLGYNTSIIDEFNYSYNELIGAGVNPNAAKKAIRKAYKYFDSLGAFL